MTRTGSRRWVALIALTIAMSILASGCVRGGSSFSGSEGKDIKQLPPELVPTEVLDLKVGREDMSSTLQNAKRAYIDGVGLYGFRKDELLQATLQVSKLNDKADYREPSFRAAIVNQIGGSVPRLVRVGRENVWLTRGTKQSLSIWFRDEYLLVLAVREDYDKPRTLLREALQLDFQGKGA